MYRAMVWLLRIGHCMFVCVSEIEVYFGFILAVLDCFNNFYISVYDEYYVLLLVPLWISYVRNNSISRVQLISIKTRDMFRLLI